MNQYGLNVLVYITINILLYCALSEGLRDKPMKSYFTTQEETFRIIIYKFVLVTLIFSP